MKEKGLLIIGIDPGVTIAYAILDIEGNLVKIDSSKQLDINTIISETIRLGKAIIVGTDKSKVPGFVDSFATKIGAHIVSPREDLKVDEKRAMTEHIATADDHQQDALASALFAYRSIKPLLDKVDLYAERNRKTGIKNGIKELVISKKISIRAAADIIERKDEPAMIVEKAVVKARISENDFIRLFERLKKSEAEARILRNYNNRLKNALKTLEASKKEEPKPEKILDFREKRIASLESSLLSRQRETEKLRHSMQRLNSFISKINDFYVLKKLDTLGWNEFEFKNKTLDIRKNDILLVNDPNIVSSKVIEHLKDLVYIIVHLLPLSRKNGHLPFVFINARVMEIHEEKDFGFVDKKQFDMQKEKSSWARKIIEDYQREKELLR